MNDKLFDERVVELGFSSDQQLKRWLLNKKIIIKSIANNHNYGRINSKVILNNPDMIVNIEELKVNHGITDGNEIWFKQFIVLEDVTLILLEEELKKLEQTYIEETKKIKAKITLIKEIGCDYLNENIIKSYSIVKLLPTRENQRDKILLVNDIMNSRNDD